MEKTLKGKKQVVKLTTFLFLSLLVLTLYKTPKFNKNSLTYKTIELTKKPEFKKKCGYTSGCNYWLELNSKITDLKITGTDYQYLKYYEFKKNIKIGDKLEIGIIDENILTLSKDKYEYLRFEKAQFHKQQSKKFSIYLFSTAIVLCLIILLLKKEPKIGSNQIDFGCLFWVGLIICFLILILTIGLKFISGSEFIE